MVRKPTQDETEELSTDPTDGQSGVIDESAQSDEQADDDTQVQPDEQVDDVQSDADGQPTSADGANARSDADEHPVSDDDAQPQADGTAENADQSEADEQFASADDTDATEEIEAASPLADSDSTEKLEPTEGPESTDELESAENLDPDEDPEPTEELEPTGESDPTKELEPAGESEPAEEPEPAGEADLTEELAPTEDPDLTEEIPPTEDPDLTEELEPENEFNQPQWNASAARKDITTIIPPIGNAHPVNALVDVPSDSVSRTISRNEGHFRHGVAAAVVSILMVFGIGLGAGMYYRHVQSEKHTAEVIAENERKAAAAMEERDRAAREAEEQRALEASRAPRQVKFSISALEYDDSASRIPLVIKGQDFEGNDVDTEAFVNSQGYGVWLAPGNYTATIPASPILANGGLYSVPTNAYSIKVADDDKEVTNVDEAIVLIPMAAKDVTEQMVLDACDWARKDVDNAEISNANADIAGRTAEERRAQEREREQKAKLDQTRTELAQKFASSFFTNISFPDAKDDSKILVMSNWNDIVAQYVAPGSSAQQKLAGGPDPEDAYSYATSADAINVSGDTVVVDCKVISTNTPKAGWTKNTYDARMNITFNDNNKITSFTID